MDGWTVGCVSIFRTLFFIAFVDHNIAKCMSQKCKFIQQQQDRPSEGESISMRGVMVHWPTGTWIVCG